MAQADTSQSSSPARRDKASGRAPVLVLALARAGFGETTLGLRIADDLAAMGHPVHFLIHPAIERVFSGGSRDVEVLGDERGDGLDVRLGRLVRRTQPRVILLADLLMAITDLRRRHAGPKVLSRFDLPIVALDPWNLPEVGGVLDFAPGSAVPVAAEATQHPLRVVPVPFARPGVAGGANLLPSVAPLSRSARAEARAALGLGSADKLVFCATAGWQHRRYGDPVVDRVATGVPLLVGQLLTALGERVRVLHVGPSALPWAGALGDRYVHRAQLPREAFLAQLGAADLVLSLNAPATTSTAAVALGVPVLTLQNSFVGDSLDALWSWLGEAPAPVVVDWARRYTPLYRTLMWPMSAWGMLSRVLRDNPYDALLHRVELLDARRVVETAVRLLDHGEDAAARERFLAAVQRLPRPAALVRGYADLA